jgi:uncharacterized 2Fe-2S/4Fe-4S cluster protein (DUF4445 family)
MEAEKPSMEDSRSDWQRVTDCLSVYGDGYCSVSARIAVLRQLPHVLRSKDYRVTVVIHQDEIRGLEEGNSADTLLGIAFDIGTTTIVGYLMDLYTGRELQVVSALNPQNCFGADVISRITHVNQVENGLADLHSAVTNALDLLIGEAVENAGIKRADIYAVSVVGNTCMHHLFLGITPRQVALAPYVPAISEPVAVDPVDVRLAVNPAGKVFVLPNIAGFVGADMAAVLLATEMDQSREIKLIMDIGTNGEIALGSRNRIVACSAAAGPAFEGAQITYGMRGAPGAIDHVLFDDGVSFTVIGDEEPKGVCGSALLDTVAGLLKLGIINDKGKYIEPGNITNAAGRMLKDRLVKHQGAWAFLLTGDSADPQGKKILITQHDITELQLAKGAIAAGIKTLMKTLGVETEQIQEVLLAGAFGNTLNPQSACTIGLIPQELESRIKMIGNAAGAGAKLALLSSQEYKRAAQLAKNVDYVELGSDREFMNNFVRAMLFPNANAEGLRK